MGWGILPFTFGSVDPRADLSWKKWEWGRSCYKERCHHAIIYTIIGPWSKTCEQERGGEKCKRKKWERKRRGYLGWIAEVILEWTENRRPWTGQSLEQGAAHETSYLFKMVSMTGETWGGGDGPTAVLWPRLPERAGKAGQKEGFQLSNNLIEGKKERSQVHNAERK